MMTLKMRMLWICAVLVTLGAGFTIAAAVVCLGTGWSHLLELCFVSSLALAFPAAAWVELIRRRNLLSSLFQSRPPEFAPRSKYAVWSHVPRPNRLTGRPRKRARRQKAHSRRL